MINLKTCFHLWVFVYQMRKVADTPWIGYYFCELFPSLKLLRDCLTKIPLPLDWSELSMSEVQTLHMSWKHIQYPQYQYIKSISSLWLKYKKYFQWLAASDCKEGPVKPNLTRGRRYDGIMGGSHDSAAWELLYWQTQRQFMLSGK